MVVLRRKVRRPSGRSDGRVATAERFVVRRPTATVVLQVVRIVVPLRWRLRSRFAVARPRNDAVRRVGVLPEHAALERLAVLDGHGGFAAAAVVRRRVRRVPGASVSVGVQRSGWTRVRFGQSRRRVRRLVMVLLDVRRRRRQLLVIVVVVMVVVVTAVLVGGLQVDVFRRPVTADRVHAVRHHSHRRRVALLPRYVHGSAYFLAGP